MHSAMANAQWLRGGSFMSRFTHICFPKKQTTDLAHSVGCQVSVFCGRLLETSSLCLCLKNDEEIKVGRREEGSPENRSVLMT